MADYRETILADTPALYWRLGSGGGTDQSGNGRNGTAVGGVTIGGAAGLLTGDADAATDFDGTDDAITSTYDPYVVSSTRTFEGWAWRDTSAAADCLISGTTGGTSPELWLSSGQNVQWLPANTTGATWTAVWPGNTRPVHWVLVAVAGTDATLYINGALVSTIATAVNYAAGAANFEIGVFDVTTDPFDGKMDEVAVYESALTAAKIKEHYRVGLEARIGNPVRGGF